MRQFPLGLAKFLQRKVAAFDVREAFVHQKWGQGIPPSVVPFATLGNNTKMLGGDIFFLTSVG